MRPMQLHHVWQDPAHLPAVVPGNADESPKSHDSSADRQGNEERAIKNRRAREACSMRTPSRAVSAACETTRVLSSHLRALSWSSGGDHSNHLRLLPIRTRKTLEHAAASRSAQGSTHACSDEAARGLCHKKGEKQKRGRLCTNSSVKCGTWMGTLWVGAEAPAFRCCAQPPKYPSCCGGPGIPVMRTHKLSTNEMTPTRPMHDGHHRWGCTWATTERALRACHRQVRSSTCRASP